VTVAPSVVGQGATAHRCLEVTVRTTTDGATVTTTKPPGVPAAIPPLSWPSGRLGERSELRSIKKGQRDGDRET